MRFRNTRARDDILSQYIQKQNAFDLASLYMSIFIQSTPAIADTPGGGGEIDRFCLCYDEGP